ncbi:MAG: site-specific DNA-methyltransferase [Rhodospirillales bacterium]|nr:site-specific DNA-methyltransferase [Rhodospirillales bacterium]
MKPSNNKKNSFVNIRLTKAEKSEIEVFAESLGFKNVSEYYRFLHNEKIKEAADKKKAIHKVEVELNPKIFHKTKKGKIYHGDSLGLLHKKLKEESVDLIMTSPPFGLTRPKAYGNKTEQQYLNWFRDFAEGFQRVLKPEGSLVIDIGGAWTKGEPTRSLYHFDLLIMLCREYGFHLAQEHYWWNPSKLPSPVEWVNVRRCRVKDAVNCVWWLSKTPHPKANNRNVLAPYSKSMQHLLKNGYSRNLRPSGHDISDKFGTDNGGAVPPNLIALANTESNSYYQNYCRENNLTVHPARFPSGLPEYFIKMLTDPGDMVLDPFGGSCVTGEVAERLDRQWICCEMLDEYLEGAVGRFASQDEIKKRTEPYQIHPPCALATA